MLVPTPTFISNWPPVAPIASRFADLKDRVVSHRRAVRRLCLELEKQEGLRCRLVCGEGNGPVQLLEPGARVVVCRERLISVNGCRIRPDLTVRCARTAELLGVIEVWHSHAVGRSKRELLDRLGVPWIEVRTWHVLWRHRNQPLPVVDWGGLLCSAPRQTPLF